MNHFEFFSAFFLVLSIGIGILNCDDRSIAELFADNLELNEISPLDDVPNDDQPIDAQNECKPDPADDDEFIFENMPQQNSETSVLMKYLLVKVRCQIPKKLNHLVGTIRYQSNRFWNVTFPNKSSTDVFVHFSASVNLERKLFSQIGNDANPWDYEPLPGQYYIEAQMKMEPKSENGLSTELINVATVDRPSHLDGAQMKMLNGALGKVQDKLDLKFQVRYGRILAFEILSNHPVFGQRIQFGAILEKKSTFCAQTVSIPCAVYVPLHETSIESIYNITVQKHIIGSELIDLNKLDFHLSTF